MNMLNMAVGTFIIIIEMITGTNDLTVFNLGLAALNFWCGYLKKE